MNTYINIMYLRIITIIMLLPLQAKAVDKDRPYKGMTGTVHQVGFIGGIYNTVNPNCSPSDVPKSFRDFGLGATYTLHYYVTKQFAFDIISSVTVMTAKYLVDKNIKDSNCQKIVWPVDCRFFLGPSENFQAYIGTGIQWSLFEKTVGDVDIMTGKPPRANIHQLSGNTAVGLNLFGPQNYMFHLNVGAKLHYAIADNDRTSYPKDFFSLGKDIDCLILTGGVTVDLDRKKSVCIILNCDYPIGNIGLKSGDTGLFNRSHTIYLGVMFHVGGTR